MLSLKPHVLFCLRNNFVRKQCSPVRKYTIAVRAHLHHTKRDTLWNIPVETSEDHSSSLSAEASSLWPSTLLQKALVSASIFCLSFWFPFHLQAAIEAESKPQSVTGYPAQESFVLHNGLHPFPTEFPPLRDVSIPTFTQVELRNGLRLFMLEDHETSLMGGQLLIKGGGKLDPASKVGLASITSSAQRSGGTESMNSEDLNYFLESMAARIEAGSSTSEMSVGFRCLSEDLESIFPIFSDVVRRPAMPAEKVALLKSQLIGAIDRRNDDPSSVASRQLAKVVYGSSSPFSRLPSKDGVDSVSREDVLSFHQALFRPDRAVLGVWGDFDPADVLRLVEANFGAWEAPSANQKPSGDPAPEADPQEEGRSALPAGLYLVDRPGVTQGYVRMGEYGTRLDDPDVYPLEVLDSVLNGFGGRLFDQIRSREGLAYSVFGSFSPALEHRGYFVAGGETQLSSVPKLISALQTLLTSATEELPDADEVKRAKDSTLNSFVFNFANTASQMRRIITYDLFGIDQDFILKYKRGIEQVSERDVLKAAKRRLHPRDQPIVVVADAKVIRKELETLGLPIIDVSMD